jgi:hypothetical protein
MLKVFLGGEGKNDIGTRWHEPMGEHAGVVEVLLRRVRATGWRVASARCWQHIRKYQTGAGRLRPNHEDAHNVLGLVLHAYEEACEMLAFVRDLDAEDQREREIQRVLDEISEFGFANEYHYELAIVAGIAKPKLEGWILCLLGVAGTDAMTRARVDRELAATDIKAKSTEHYVAVIESCALPSGDGSLPAWLADVDAAFRRLIDGELVEGDPA